MNRSRNTQWRVGGAGPLAVRTPTLSEDNFALQRALARRELIERERYAKAAKRKARLAALLSPMVRARSSAWLGLVSLVVRAGNSVARAYRGTVSRVQHGLREAMERKA
ncbi:MAG: hypothetical protein AAGD22_17335 [Verrucomicrobiota bacterium]